MVSGKLQPEQLITHHFTLDQLMQAYDTFGNAMKEEALKVIITNGIMLNEEQASGVTGQSLTEELIANNSPGG